MMSVHLPRVSIGVPVYNGEAYLTAALDSILAQTFTDYEIILSDNGSTDATAEIARAYAARDNRIHFYRVEENLGAAWNFNRVFTLARGQYFKWAAHDDLLAPTFLHSCVAVLDHNPRVVLAYPWIEIIDDQTQVIDHYRIHLHTQSARPLQRFRDLLIEWHLCYEIFGLIRADALRQTPLMGNYGHGDGILLERLALLGPFYEIPQPLFFARKHARQSMNMFGVYQKGENNYHQYTLWFDPSKSGKIIFPTWRMLQERLLTLKIAPFTGKDRWMAYAYLAKWIRRKRRPLFFDLQFAARQFWKQKFHSTQPKPLTQ